MITRHSGMIALTTVLIVGAIVLVAGIGISTRSIIDSNMTVDKEQSNTALALATSCMETALLTLSNNAAYAGNQTLTFDGQSCIIQTVETSGTTKIIKTSATIGGYVRRLRVVVSNPTPPLQISSWQEVSSF